MSAPACMMSMRNEAADVEEDAEDGSGSEEDEADAINTHKNEEDLKMNMNDLDVDDVDGGDDNDDEFDGKHPRLQGLEARFPLSSFSEMNFEDPMVELGSELDNEINNMDINIDFEQDNQENQADIDDAENQADVEEIEMQILADAANASGESDNETDGSSEESECSR